MDELKAELSKHKLNTAGKKDDLKARLQEFLDSQASASAAPEAAEPKEGPSPKKQKTSNDGKKKDAPKERAEEKVMMETNMQAHVQHTCQHESCPA